MSRLYSLNELNAVSPELAWKLVDSLYQQTRALVIGAIIFSLVGVIGFCGTGSFWYLGASAVFVAVCAVRAWFGHLYAVHRDTASCLTWARRSQIGGWVAASCWGLWGSAAILFEAEKSLVVMVIGVLAGALMGSAVRNCAVLTVAVSQIFIMLMPLFLACLASGNPYFMLFAFLLPLNAFAALSLTRFLHTQTMQLLVGNEEKSALLAGLEVARLELETVNTHLEGLVVTDALTGIANRRAFDFATAREWRRALRDGTTLALLFIDVDHFKTYNDFYGHQAGDQCLQDVASTIGSVLRRPADLLARYGGEEFAVILPRTDLAGATEIGEAIIAAFTALAMPHDTAVSYGHVSVSIGAACMIAGPDTAAEHLTALADSALYAAKRGGRNRVVAANMPVQRNAMPSGLAHQSDARVRA